MSEHMMPSKLTGFLYKFLRFATSALPIADTRQGLCNRCGDCCKLPNPCRFLRYDENGLSSCAVYRWRPPSCRKYPRTERENLTPQPCGYYFVRAEVPVALIRDLDQAQSPGRILPEIAD
jgi:hypothetical protein